ncbi:MAG: hypothetical protein ACI9GW_000617 [Halieaceae bacterium]|jgi:hypothetical protein
MHLPELELPTVINRFILSLNLTQRLAVLTILLCLLVGLTLVSVSTLSSRYMLDTSAEKHGHVLARQLAARSSTALLNNDKISLRAILAEFVGQTNIDLGAIHDVSMLPMARAGNPDLPDLQTFTAEIRLNDAIAGYASISISGSNNSADQNIVAASLLGLALLLSGFAFAVASRNAQGLVTRLQELIESVRELAPIEESDPPIDEIDTLRNELSILPLEVLRSAVTGKQRRKTRLTALLHVKLNGLDHYLGKLDHPSLVAYLDDLAPCLQAAAKLYGGSLRHSRHSAVTIVFTDDHPSGDIYERCCYCAWLIKDLLVQVSASRTLRYTSSMAGLTVQLDGDTGQASFDSFLQEQLIDQLEAHCKAQPATILLANDIIESDSDQFTATLANVTNYVVLTGLDAADQSALERQRDSIIAHLLRPSS